MKKSSLKIKLLIIATIILFSGYFIWSVMFGAKEIDLALQREAEANSPECNYPKGEIDMNRVYTENELEESAAQAMACIEAKIEYIKAKRVTEK